MCNRSSRTGQVIAAVKVMDFRLPTQERKHYACTAAKQCTLEEVYQVASFDSLCVSCSKHAYNLQVFFLLSASHENIFLLVRTYDAGKDKSNVRCCTYM
ncbi:unnamed protein product [Allacma fusca]|uniref:Uncharacterized protein n=1 Tax=Allacma fusca TaxID=39272 RepID=A0A8J2PGQ3_9HEXA|nr:unnamed protein product [Allacma fusca]